LKSQLLKFSIVSPVYLAETVITELVSEIYMAMENLGSYEIILVEDSSPDNSWKIIEQLSKKYSSIKAIKLSRNFGQHAAITAGLNYAKGEWVIVMDCDLQDKPSEIPRLYSKAKEGFDIVQAKRTIRYDGFFKKTFSRFFYKLFEILSGVGQDHTIANFGIYNKKVIKAFNTFNEPLRSFPSIINWIGYSKTSIEVAHGINSDDRKTSYSVKKLIRLALSIIVSYSNKPLHISIIIGVVVSMIGFMFGSFYVVRYAFLGNSVSGFTTLISSIWFLSGIILIMMGILGIYLSSIFDTVKSRPLFLVDEELGFLDNMVQ